MRRETGKEAWDYLSDFMGCPFLVYPKTNDFCFGSP
jgi:hypothetical protein